MVRRLLMRSECEKGEERGDDDGMERETDGSERRETKEDEIGKRRKTVFL